ncbi:MAG: hypothetical protein J0M33_23855 [Anaerolineae bacterium]|nr:hypothetical protein [Anaerolineae bacterium]
MMQTTIPQTESELIDRFRWVGHVELVQLLIQLKGQEPIFMSGQTIQQHIDAYDAWETEIIPVSRELNRRIAAGEIEVK